METSGFRHHHHHQSHVPQQSRRDKLRVQQQVLGSTPISHHHLDNDLPNSFDHHQHEFTTHLHGQDHLNLQIHGRNVIRHNDNNFLYDHQAGNINVSSENILGDHHRPMSISPGSDVPQSLMINWPAVPTTNFASSSAPRNNVLEQPQIISSQDHVRVQKYYLEGMNLTNDNDNMVGDQVVTVASTRENELALLPFSFASLETAHGEDQIRSTTVVNDPNLQGLSLSLSSINPQHMARVADHHQGSSDSDQDLPKPIPKPSIIGKACGKSLQDIVGVSSGPGYRSNNTGPLGPFTGYATILKSSRFLKPAQQLLEEFCGSKLMMNEGNAATTSSSPCDVNSERASGDLSASVSASDNRANVNTMDQTSCHDYHHQVAANIINNNSNNNNNNSCASSSTFYGSNEMNSGIGSSVSFESGSSRPEHVQQKKAKLLYMQEEVSRRYKQYRQQMQMVVSSFESVAGLSSATPYISLALKAVSRHFRCLKSAIADQLNHTMSALGEENIFQSPAAGKAATDHSVTLKYMDQGFQKHRSAGGPNMAFHEPQQHHIWRPQRGLPERSVAVLRAWLFEHFLHPYPTDTDKHMLATQTGLTRNQVSNWFINARVRVWKPMVEEIHTLETKGLSGTDQGNGGPASSNDHVQASPAKLGNRSSVALLGADQHDEQSQEKRSRLDFAQAQAHQAPAGLAGSVVQGFVPYLRGGLEVWSRAEQ